MLDRCVRSMVVWYGSSETIYRRVYFPGVGGGDGGTLTKQPASHALAPQEDTPVRARCMNDEGDTLSFHAQVFSCVFSRRGILGRALGERRGVVLVGSRRRDSVIGQGRRHGSHELLEGEARRSSSLHHGLRCGSHSGTLFERRGNGSRSFFGIFVGRGGCSGG